MMSRRHIRVAAALAAAAAVAIAARVTFGQQSAAGAAAERSVLEGDWVRLDTAGSGDFGGLTSKFTPAALTPEATTMMTAVRQAQNQPRGGAFTENRVHKEGEPYIVVDRPCGGGFGGALGVNPDSGAIHVIAQKDEVIIAPERGGSRHIFMDGRGHPDLSRGTPTASGHAVGHYENGVLVVDTVGFIPGPVTAGGFRTPETHLTERFEVSPDGKRLTIKYTWSDPRLYQKPHSYEYVLERLPADSYALEEWCDASDPIEQQSIVPPKQIQ
ncbi:MAG: hypothetical protein C5B57_02405 [Blastocatellia bacterium]|nr:MAG: hypothetical protein C5B57_02405 [Blastocatellia bacterium]